MFLFPMLRALAMLLSCACAVQLAHAQPASQPGAIYQLQLPAAGSAPAAEGSVQFVGTATVIIRYQGFTILTDPNFLPKGEQANLGYGITSERLTNPAIAFDQLPQIDLVLLSHFHDDHFDTLVQQRLNRATPIVTTKESGERLKRMGYTRVFGLSTWDRLEVAKGEARLRLTAAPGRHGPAGIAVLLPKVMGTVLDFGPNPDAPSYRMYISGDTMVIDAIQEIAQRYPRIDLALLHLGGARIFGVVKATMDDKDGVRMMQVVQPKKTIPIHYNDYDLFKSSLDAFKREVRAAGLEQQVVYLAHGETYSFGPVQP